MNIDYQLIDKFFEGNTTAEETVLVLTAISANPDLEEYFITRKRLEYANEQTEDYSSFIPASSMAADDGMNLCDFQCETFILKKAGIVASEDELAIESKTNYWLRGQGTPLYNIGEHSYYLSDEFKKAHDNIPWAKISGLRHRLVHDYEDTNWSIICNIIFDVLPGFLCDVTKLTDD